jgi:glycosyltransferase involved in cell wall biosynthesis
MMSDGLSNSGLVSVLMAAYNAEYWIGEAIASVQAQGYLEWELICVDDGSQDNTAEIVKGLESGDHRIRLLRHEHLGAASARNAAFVASRGEYIVIFDADDRLHPDKFGKQVTYLCQHQECGAVYHDTWHCDENGNRIKRESMCYPGRHVVGDIFNNIVCENIMSVHSVMVRRQCLMGNELHPVDIPVIFDWDLWVRVAESYRFGYLSEAMCDYRIHAAMSMMSDAMERKYLNRKNTFERIVAMKRFKVLPRKTLRLFYFNHAKSALACGIYRDARIFFFRSVSADWMFIRAYVGLLISLLPHIIIKMAIMIFKTKK